MASTESQEGGDVAGGREQAILASQDVHDRACFTR
jgi:hypothetical protein